MAKRGPSERHALDDASVTRLWNACKTPQDKVLVGLTMMCGMRVGEAVHLQGWWIRQGDIASAEIIIPPTMECGCYECLQSRGYWKPKSTAGARAIPVPEIFERHLLDFIGKQPGGLGFVRQTGWRKIKSLAIVAKIDYLNPHALRATAATNYAKAGFTAIELCYIMGWSRIEIGAHYIQLIQARQGVAEKMKKVYRAS